MDLIELFAKIDSYSELQPGWDYYDGKPSSLQVIKLAKEILTNIHISFVSIKLDCTPTSAGGLVLHIVGDRYSLAYVVGGAGVEFPYIEIYKKFNGHDFVYNGVVDLDHVSVVDATELLYRLIQII